MSLVKLWDTGQLEGKDLSQVIPFVGGLKDGSNASKDFRELLSYVPLSKIEEYAEECLSPERKFPDSGFALQDMVNALGRRLGFEVEEGRYRGTSNEVGYDGLWKLPDGKAIIVEVKTTDVYNLKIESIVNYRKDLISGNERFKKEDVSFLLVVGRDETNSWENQIRGSRYAWDMRLISVSAMLTLAKLREKMDDDAVFNNVRNVLVPKEFTKLDEISNLILSVVMDVEEEEPDTVLEGDKLSKQKKNPSSFREECIFRFEEGKNLPVKLVRKARNIWQSVDSEYGAVCLVSKLHKDKHYWHTLRTSRKEFLERVKESYLILGCGSEETLFVIPSADFISFLPKLNETIKPDEIFWHIRIRDEDGKWLLKAKADYENENISKYLL